MNVTKIAAIAALVVSSLSFAYAQVDEDQEVRPSLRGETRLGGQVPPDQDPPEEEVKVPRAIPEEHQYAPPVAIPNEEQRPNTDNNPIRVMTYEDAKRLIESDRAEGVRRARQLRSPVQANRLLRQVVDEHTIALARLRKGLYRDLYGVKWELRKFKEKFEKFEKDQLNINQNVNSRLGIVEDQTRNLGERLTALENASSPQPNAPKTGSTNQSNSDSAAKAVDPTADSNFMNWVWGILIAIVIAAIFYYLFLPKIRPRSS